MEKVQDKIKQDNVAFEAYKCASCGEELVDGNQLRALAAKYRSLRTAKTVKFSKWGNSLAVRIPHEYVNDLKLSEGKKGLLVKEDDGIKITVL